MQRAVMGSSFQACRQASAPRTRSLRLLARAVFVVDRGGVIRYVQLVKDTGTQPDFAPVLEAVKSLQQQTKENT